jgi:predicted dehydrogenase
MRSVSRRSFLKQSAAAATLFPFLAGHPWAAPIGANERIRVCVMGVRQRGRQHINTFLKIPEVEIACVGEVDDAIGGREVDRVRHTTKKAPQQARDIRKVLADKTIHAVAIATPNHWHTLAAYWACQAGKDVLVEKPLSHNLAEGRRLVEAARYHRRVVQQATQYRSAPGIRAAIDFLRQGKLGTVNFARAVVYKPKPGIGMVGTPQDPPAGVDYDLWCGPAPRPAKLHRLKLHYDWHCVWDYGNGEIGNQGTHQIDICRWGLGKKLPRSGVSCGGRFGPPDDGQIADTQLALFDYGDDCRMLVEVRNLPSPAHAGSGIHVGEVFYGAEGRLVVGHYGAAVAYLGKDDKPLVVGEPSVKAPGKPSATDYDEGHIRNFLSVMRSRKVEDLFADVEEGHLSCAHVHLANISYRLGRDASFQARQGAFARDLETAEAFQRMQAHLHENKVMTQDTTCRFGRMLHVNAEAETLIGDREADMLRTREYRAPFVVPEKVT